MCGCALDQGIVFLLIRRAGIVGDHDGYGVAVAPEVIVILFDGFTDLAQAIGGNDEE
jgi:hypothetical protein